MRLTRFVVALACVVMAGCHVPVHLFGRYDCRTGAVQEQQGGDLIDRLLDEAGKQRVEDTFDGTTEN